MKIVFVSNYFNHHQKPFADSLFHTQSVSFSFVETMEMDAERVAMGWKSTSCPQYVIRSYQGEEERKRAKLEIAHADVVIWGSAPYSLILNRLISGKLTFRYAERQFKAGCSRRMLFLRKIKYRFKFEQFRNFYLLASSAFTTADYAKTNTFTNRAYKWGYFPEVRQYDLEKLMLPKKGWKHPCASILWAGRLIGLKHPDASILLAESLKQQGYQFKLSIIGNGHLEQKLHMMISEKGLDGCVEMLGAMAPEEVREHMEKANIFLFTSDFNEGWGAVLNESMNSGCAVVASHAIGAVPYLIKHKENGLIYHSGNIDELCKNVKYLLDNPAEQERLGRAAYETIVGEWNAETAAERLVALSKKILDGEKQPDLFEKGPCSRAEIIQDNWFNP